MPSSRDTKQPCAKAQRKTETARYTECSRNLSSQSKMSGSNSNMYPVLCSLLLYSLQYNTSLRVTIFILYQSLHSDHDSSHRTIYFYYLATYNMCKNWPVYFNKFFGSLIHKIHFVFKEETVDFKDIFSANVLSFRSNLLLIFAEKICCACAFIA